MKFLLPYVGFFIGLFIGACTNTAIFVLIFAFLGTASGAWLKDELEQNERQRRAAEEAEKKRIAAEKAERQRRAAEEAEKKRIAAEEAEKKRIAAEEAEKQRHAAEEAEKQRHAAEETEKQIQNIFSPLLRRVAEETEKQRRAAEEAERQRRAAEEAERQRRAAEEAEKQRHAAEETEKQIQNIFSPLLRRVAEETEKQKQKVLLSSLLHCVSSWFTHSQNGEVKHKWFVDYYPYNRYKYTADYSMKRAWFLVWHFKNESGKGITPLQHNNALNEVVELVTNELYNTFGDKAHFLTFVCLTASSQTKTEDRFRDFAERVCSNLNMENAFTHIRVIDGGCAKHEGGTGYHTVWHDDVFFKGKYIVLFDDVRTSGGSIITEKNILEKLGAKIICAITLAQTRH